MYAQLYRFIMKVFISILLLSIFAAPQLPDDLPLNQMQVIGSHNSYKKAIDPKLFAMLQKVDSAGMSKIDYEHITLSEQLDLGLCNLEIDVYADSLGGKYAHPKGLDWVAGQAPYDSSMMREPGFKVFHIQDIDFRSQCPTFKSCLQQLKTWSDRHPDHLPVFITMNAKDEVMKQPNFTIPEKFTSETFDRLDREIADYLGQSYLLTPDMVRGSASSLESAILKKGWPMLKSTKGKFIFILDENKEKRTAYIAGHPSLKGRMLFADAEPGTPEAAIHIMNDAKRDEAKIAALVKKGYIIRTRADGDTHQARANDMSSFEAAQRSGAQIITTDYYEKSTHFASDYVVHFQDGGFVRKNPINK
jgi:Phosphoinositide phospholipase C, Ca2+-dependent